MKAQSVMFYRKTLEVKAFFFLFSVLLLNSMKAEDENPLPNAFFQAIFWGTKEAELFSYAPWGNAMSPGANIVDVVFSSNGLSGKFAYYGLSPLRIYKKIDYSALEPTKIQDGKDPSSPKLELVFEHSFTKSVGGVITEEILLLKQNTQKKILCNALPFSQEKVPNGSFLFQSFAQEPTFYKVGLDRLRLNSGESKLVTPKVDLGEKTLIIEGFILRKEKYKSALVRKIGAFQKLRGLFLINVKKNSIKPTMLIETRSNYDTAMGYGEKPFFSELDIEDNASDTLP